MVNETITNNSGQDDEISLLDLFAVLWRRKWMIIIITMLAAIGVVTYCFISIKLPPEKSFLPNVYTSKALMLIDNKSSSGGGLSSMLNSSGMGGLAALAGINVQGSSNNNSQLAVFLVETDSLLDSVVDKFNLIDKYKITTFPKTNSRNMLKGNLKAEIANGSGVLTVEFTHIDPVFARDVVNYCTAYLEKRFDELGLDKNKIEKENLEINIANTFQEIRKLEEERQNLERSVSSSGGRLPAITMDMTRIALELDAKREVYTQLKVQYEILMVTMASEKPIFQILEKAEIPEKKSGPKRALICIIVTLAAGFFAVFLAFVLNAIANIKKDPEAMAKLRGINEK